MRYLDDAGLAEIEQAGYDLALFRKGKRYYELYCTSCHRADVPQGMSHGEAARLAPPAFAVAHHYRRKIPDLNERVDAFAAFVLNPSEDDALMPGAVERFGLMSRLNLPEDQLKATSLFLAAGQFERPGWYAEHYAEEHGEAP